MDGASKELKSTKSSDDVVGKDDDMEACAISAATDPSAAITVTDAGSDPADDPANIGPFAVSSTPGVVAQTLELESQETATTAPSSANATNSTTAAARGNSMNSLPPGAYRAGGIARPTGITAGGANTTEGDPEDPEALIEAYTVSETADGETIDNLNQELGVARQQLDVARAQLATPVPMVEGVPFEKDGKKGRTMAIGALLIVAVGAIVVSVSVYFTRNSSTNSNDPPKIIEAVAKVQLPPVLETLKERKLLRCGVGANSLGFSKLNEDTNKLEGFEIDLCKAVAAAASVRYETVDVTPVNRFLTLASGDVDLVVAGTTHTFERDVHQESAQMGFSFSTPYLYGGLTFSGVPEYVACADELSVVGDCADLLICVIPGTTWMAKTKALFPGSNIISIPEQATSIQSLMDKKCNVIEGEQFEAPEVTVRYYGYNGTYAMGKNSFSKEPLAIVTRDGDTAFADFVNWVLNSLLYAEAQNITMETASTFPKTRLFGDAYENMFQDAVAAVGNYGELYSRHLDPIAGRLKVNMINNGDTGLLYSHPYGQVNTIGPGPIEGGVIARIIERESLRCGISSRNDQSDNKKVGLDIEYCRALSSSVLKGKMDSIEFKEYDNTTNIALALLNGDIDVYAGGNVRQHGDVRYEMLSFSKPYFFEAPKEGSLTAGKAHSLVTKEDDAQWSDFVYWVIMATFDAEELGITQTTSNEMPLISIFGPSLERVLRNTILAVGNYGQMYQRVFGQDAPRVGRNLLNAPPFGPEHHPLPF